MRFVSHTLLCLFPRLNIGMFWLTDLWTDLKVLWTILLKSTNIYKKNSNIILICNRVRIVFEKLEEKLEVRKEKKVFFEQILLYNSHQHGWQKKPKHFSKRYQKIEKKIRKTIRVSFLIFLEILATFVRYKRKYRNQGKPRNQLFTC